MAPPATPEPPYIGDLLGPEVDHRPLPPLVGELVDEVARLAGAAPAAVAAVTLATFAAAVGPRVKVQRGHRLHPLGFNVVVSHVAPRTLPWFDLVTAPFVGRVFEMQLALAKTGKARMQSELTQQQTEYRRACKTSDPNPELLDRLKSQIDRAGASLKPSVTSSSVVPKDLDRLLPEAFDGGIVLMGTGSDPGAELLRLKAPVRAHLAELLNRSWESVPLAFGRAVHEGHLSMLWQTRVAIKDVLGHHGFEPGLLAVPTLYFQEESASGVLPTLAYEELWMKCCHAVFDLRCLNRESTYRLNADAETALTNFSKDVAGKLTMVPARLRPQAVWLPELTARLAAIFTIFSDQQTLVVNALVMNEAIRTTRWLGRQHLLAAAAALDATDTADSADKKPVLLAKIRNKGPISQRELRRTFDNQRARWFDEALDTLIEEKKVRYDGSMRLVAC